MTDGVIDRKHKHAEQQTNSRDDRNDSACPVVRFARARCSLDLGVVNNFKKRFIEVATFVRFRIEEETLGATFHDGQSLNGFFRMRPVFLRIEPTLLSSFFGSSFAVVVLVVFADAFLTGAVAGCLVGAGLGSSAAGTGTGSIDGSGCGVGFTSGAGMDVLAAVDGVSMTGGVAFRCVDT